MKDLAYFCPECNSPTVERSVLAGGGASCRSCQWRGTNDELRAVPFEHDFSSPEQVLQRFATEIARLVAQHLSAPMGTVLVKWGFLDLAHAKTDLAIYMRNIAIAVAKSVFETRDGLASGTISRDRKATPATPRKGTH